MDEADPRRGRKQGWNAACRPVASWFDQGIQDVIGLRIAGGATVWATPDHKVLTEYGWRQAGELRKGDRVAQPRRSTDSVTVRRFRRIRHDCSAI